MQCTLAFVTLNFVTECSPKVGTFMVSFDPAMRVLKRGAYIDEYDYQRINSVQSRKESTVVSVQRIIPVYM